MPERLKIKKVLAVLTPMEAALIKMAREHEFGEGTFKMRDGQPFQMFFTSSKILEEKEGLDLEDAVVIPPGSENAIIHKLVKDTFDGKG